MKAIYSIETDQSGTRAYLKCGRNRSIAFYSPRTQTRDIAKAVRALAYRLLETAGAYEFAPDMRDAEEQAKIMFIERRGEQ